LAASGELAFALQNEFGGNLHHEITLPQLGVGLLFVTVHTNAIVVTIRISIADLIGEGGNTARLPRAANTLALLLLTDISTTATVAR